MICFYHSADLDGHCSGAIVKYAFPDCEMVGIDYGQPFPWHLLDEGNHKEVWMVDFSLQPFSDMVKLDGMCNLTWIDHHKSAIEEYKAAYVDGPPHGDFVLDSDFAACELVWNDLAKFSMRCGRDVSHIAGKSLPRAVYLLGRYDIWKHGEVEGALAFQYGLRRYHTWPGDEQVQGFWADLFAEDADLKDIIDDGDVMLDYEKSQNAKFMAAYGFEVEFGGLRCIAANRGMSNSLLFDSVYDPEKHDAMLMFAWRNGQFTVSLYSTKPEVDVSAICKAHGGGGHKGAAGFQCTTLPFLGVK